MKKKRPIRPALLLLAVVFGFFLVWSYIEKTKDANNPKIFSIRNAQILSVDQTKGEITFLDREKNAQIILKFLNTSKAEKIRVENSKKTVDVMKLSVEELESSTEVRKIVSDQREFDALTIGDIPQSATASVEHNKDDEIIKLRFVVEVQDEI